MAIEAKIKKDYYVTEVSIASHSDVKDVHEVLKASKANGKMVVLYNQGSVQGINVEQRTKVSALKAEKIRPLLEIEDEAV